MSSCSTPGGEEGALLCPFLEPGTWPSGPVGREDGVAAVQARSGWTIEECETDAVARKLPRPTTDMAKRPRRNRRSLALQAAFQETLISHYTG
ncbi:hypothetical protein GUJ93_ZPchr0002g24579 [Zizania palustris]|uniref:Uncharacterized protein n=1 Tax=Zizania palustris TaxID=103762 RepID=A0A8J5RWK5_ZIZPA|nr:hypothetical protein GUJ93_ZPchr0002g24579 [Zizania palustris]